MLWLLPLLAAAPGTCAIAILDFENGRAAPDTAKVLADALAIELGAHTGCRIVTSADIRSMANFESIRQNLGCDVAGCLAELGGALGVDRVVTGDLALLNEGSVVINARIADVKSTSVVGRANITSGRTPTATRDAAPRVARALLGEVEPTPGPVLAGYVVGGVGVVAGVVGGAVIAMGELTLSDAGATGKDTALTMSRVGALVTGIGVASVIVGGLLWASGGES